MRAWSIALAIALIAAGCHDHDHDEHGDHGDHDDHDEHAAGEGESDEQGHKHSDDDDAFGCTRWTPGYELFVEIDPADPGKEIGYHAHITKLKGFQPAREGSLVVEWWKDGEIVSEARADKIARAGIFTPTSVAPAAGKYNVVVEYTQGEDRARFDCGEREIGAHVHPEDDSGASLSFLKEQQWVVPFETAVVEKRKMAREIELPAVVEPAGTDQLTVSAPTSGRFFHNPKLSLAEGLHVKKGARIGSISPTVAGDDYNELTGAVDEALLARKQARAELVRIKPLVADGLLPQKRATEAQNEIDRHNAKLRAARKRLARVVAPGGAGGLTVKSSLAGVVTEILVANGEPVEPGAPLVRIGGEHSRWLRARFVSRPEHELDMATPVAVRTSSGERIDIRGKAKLLSHHPIVDQRTLLATWIARVSLADKKEPSHELRSGARVVLLVSVGKPKERIAVPRGTVVDINTRPYVFVQLDGEAFEKRRVSVGVADNDFIEILSGVKPKERVVVKGGYDIHLASTMGATESHKH